MLSVVLPSMKVHWITSRFDICIGVFCFKSILVSCMLFSPSARSTPSYSCACQAKNGWTRTRTL